MVTVCHILVACRHLCAEAVGSTSSDGFLHAIRAIRRVRARFGCHNVFTGRSDGSRDGAEVT